MENQQQEIEDVVEVFQDAQAISEEIKYNQEQINDIINQNTENITGKEDLYEVCSVWRYDLIGIVDLRIRV